MITSSILAPRFINSSHNFSKASVTSGSKFDVKGSFNFPKDMPSILRGLVLGVDPLYASKINLVSSTDRAIGPGVSNVGDSGKIPSVGHLSLVVFKPTIPFSEAGILTEPPVSVPIAKAAKPEATATADPLLEPPGIL